MQQSPKNYQVAFKYAQGQWMACVEERFPSGMCSYPLVPVFLEMGLTMENVTQCPTKHIRIERNSKKEMFVACTQQFGLLGGGKEEGKCIYRENEKKWDEGLRSWVCPGTGKHPRSGSIQSNKKTESQSTNKTSHTATSNIRHSNFVNIIDLSGGRLSRPGIANSSRAKETEQDIEERNQRQINEEARASYQQVLEIGARVRAELG